MGREKPLGDVKAADVKKEIVDADIGLTGAEFGGASVPPSTAADAFSIASCLLLCVMHPASHPGPGSSDRSLITIFLALNLILPSFDRRTTSSLTG
jgi:hypothetical protein